MAVIVSEWGIAHSTLYATPCYFKKKGNSFDLCHDDTQTKTDCRLRIEGTASQVYLVIAVVVVTAKEGGKCHSAIIQNPSQIFVVDMWHRFLARVSRA